MVYLLLISNTHGVFQPIESDGFNETNPGSNKAVPVGQMKGGDKVLSILHNNTIRVSTSKCLLVHGFSFDKNFLIARQNIQSFVDIFWNIVDVSRSMV